LFIGLGDAGSLINVQSEEKAIARFVELHLFGDGVGDRAGQFNRQDDQYDIPLGVERNAEEAVAVMMTAAPGVDNRAAGGTAVTSDIHDIIGQTPGDEDYQCMMCWFIHLKSLPFRRKRHLAGRMNARPVAPS